MKTTTQMIREFKKTHEITKCKSRDAQAHRYNYGKSKPSQEVFKIAHEV